MIYGEKEDSSKLIRIPLALKGKVKLKDIRLIELINPWDICFEDNARYKNVGNLGSMAICNSRSLNTMKRDDLEALKLSIKRYGLLNPLIVVKLSKKQIKEAYGSTSLYRGSYAIIDGQRRYFALMELFHRDTDLEQLHTPHKIKKHFGFRFNLENNIQEEYKEWQKRQREEEIKAIKKRIEMYETEIKDIDKPSPQEGWYGWSSYTNREEHLRYLEKQIEETKGRLQNIDKEPLREDEGVKEVCRRKVWERVLIPCLVYPYKTWQEMRRHSVEDNKFSVRPATSYLDLAERI